MVFCFLLAAPGIFSASAAPESPENGSPPAEADAALNDTPGVAVIYTTNLRGDPFTPGATLQVDVRVRNNTTAPVRNFGFRTVYDGDSLILLDSAIARDLPVKFMWAPEKPMDGLVYRNLATYNEQPVSTIKNPFLCTLQFTVEASPADVHGIRIEAFPPNPLLVDNNSSVIPAETDFSQTAVLMKYPPTVTPTFTPTPSPTPSDTPTSTPSPTPSMTPTVSPTATPSPTPTESPTASPSPLESPTPSPSPTESPTPSETPTPTESPSPTPTDSPAPSPTPSPSLTPSPSPTASPAPSPSPLPTPGPPVDTDGDGYAGWYERLSGSDENNPASTPELGDFTGDGLVNIQDAVRLFRFTRPGGHPVNAPEDIRGDVNLDGRLDAADARAIYRWILEPGALLPAN